jgi:hypothetical protein
LVTTATPTFETRSARQRQSGHPIQLHLLTEPLPALLSGLVGAKLLARHKRVVARCESARGAEAEARAALEQAGTADVEAAAQAALDGKPIPPLTVPERERELEEAERARVAAETALIRSADELLAAALPEVATAVAHAEEEIAAEQERQAEHVQLALACGERAAELRAQRVWLASVAAAPGQRRVGPYRKEQHVDEPTKLLQGVVAAMEASAERERRRVEHAERVCEVEEHQRRRDADREARGLTRGPAPVVTTRHAQGVAVERVPDDS